MIAAESNKSGRYNTYMRTRVEKKNNHIVIICELEDFEKDIVELVELLKARRYRRPIRIIIETGLC